MPHRTDHAINNFNETLSYKRVQHVRVWIALLVPFIVGYVLGSL